MEVILKILKADILSSTYTDCEDCAITRALKRAGYPQLRDTGFDISNSLGDRVTIYDDLVYEDMGYKVRGMYFGGLEPEDFKVNATPIT